jgi:hypothetical protein
MTTREQDRIYDALTEYDAGTVFRAFTNYYGLQLIDDGFAEFLEDEGIMEPEEDEDDEDEEG